MVNVRKFVILYISTYSYVHYLNSSLALSLLNATDVLLMYLER